MQGEAARPLHCTSLSAQGHAYPPTQRLTEPMLTVEARWKMAHSCGSPGFMTLQHPQLKTCRLLQSEQPSSSPPAQECQTPAAH